LIAIAIERNVSSIRRKASVSTNANTTGAAWFIWALASCSLAVGPVTPTSAPSSVPTVAGMTVLRRVCSASTAFASTPSPCIAMETSAIVPSGE
jgi:hypothetical protein